jgi:ubiquinone/menaquinone biosynthesis C-methylase UbiE
MVDIAGELALSVGAVTEDRPHRRFSPSKAAHSIAERFYEMALTKTQLRDLYRKRAAIYDYTANFYYLIGFREVQYRKRAVSALRLKHGDTVVEVGCGTGLNFPYLLQSVGETGRLIGVDLTDAMLKEAMKRVQRNGWLNVELVEADAAVYVFPTGIRGVLSTFALTLVPNMNR